MNQSLIELLEERINDAIMIALRYGGIDGAHHKSWVIDQMVRALAGEDGESTYSWDVGIAP